MNAQPGSVHSSTQYNKEENVALQLKMWGFFSLFEENAVYIANDNMCDFDLTCIQLKTLRLSVLPCF